MERKAEDEIRQSSALSPAVKKLICETGRGLLTDDLYLGLPGDGSSNSKKTEGISFFTCDYFLNIDACGKHLFNTFKELPWTSDDYVKAVIHLSPIVKECQDLQETNQPDEFSEKYKNHFQWTKKAKLFLDAFQLLTLNQEDKDLLALLITCGGIEHALGNMYCLKGSQCPALLKDLLLTDELREIFGESAIKILHVLLGPPISLNLRNVAWHGFFSVGELPKRYVYFLLVLTASLDQVLSSKGIHFSCISDRPYFSLGKADVIVKKLSGSSAIHSLAEIEQCILNSWFTDNSNRASLQGIFDLYRKGQYGFGCVQVLPVLEHILRKLFVSVNKCPERLITAEAATLYTTFEEILNYCLPDGTENQLIHVLGEPFLDLLHDLLVYPNGPRARDKLGHGEADYYSVPESVLFLILISMAFIAIRGYNLCVNDTIPADLAASVQSYESVFHPLTMLKAEIIELSQTTFSLHENINTSPDLMPWDHTSDFHMFIDGNTSYEKVSQNVSAFLENIQGSLSQHGDFEELKSRIRVPFSTVDDFVVTTLSYKRISTLHRWQKITKPSTSDVTESEIVTLMLRVISEANTSLSQSQEALLLRQQQLQQKSLRSRQRENFKRLLYFVPTLNLMMNYISILSVHIFYFLESYADIHSDSKCFNKIQRFLKNTLQVTENLRTFTASDKNKWTQSEEIILNTVQCGVKFTKQLQADS